MEEFRDNIITTINRVIEEIINLRDDIADNKKDIEEIKTIKYKLNQLELSLKPKQKLFKEKIESLEQTLKELKEIRFNMILEDTGKMFETIDKNLLDGMTLQDTNDKKVKSIIYENEVIGSIEVIEEKMPEIKIKVTVYESIEEFDVLEPRRMYAIISYINTKFNYKEI